MTAQDVLDWNNLKLGSAKKRDVLTIARAADEGGIIQAGAMVSLFPGEPTRHTCSRLRAALLWAGCEDADQDEDEDYDGRRAEYDVY